MILELRNIDKSFGEKEVLKGVSFTAEGGKAFGLLGRNGAGKTTSIRILMNVFLEIGQGHVVAVQKGEAIVVILEIERLSHAAWELIDKAKDATVGTGMLFVHQGRFKFQSDVIVFSLVDCQRQSLSVA